MKICSKVMNDYSLIYWQTFK